MVDLLGRVWFLHFPGKLCPSSYLVLHAFLLPNQGPLHFVAAASRLQGA